MLKDLREKRGITQQELSNITKISVKTLSRIENKDRNVRYINVKKLSDFFNVNLEDIIEK